MRSEANGVRLYEGDCLDILPSLPPVDAVITSPPYNCGMAYGTHNDAMATSDYLDWIERRYHAIAGAVLPGGFVCLNIPSWIGSRDEQVFAFDEIKAICDRHLRFHDLIVWAKSPPNGTAWGNYPNAPRIRANHEWVLVHRADGKPRPDSDISWAEWARLTQSVWTINPTLPDRASHPATFPLELARRLVLLFSPAGGTVLDPFSGSGTTLVAAKRLGRRAVGIEIDAKYCGIIERNTAQAELFSEAQSADETREKTT